MGRPATGQTPIHTVRVPTPIWAEAEARVGKGNMSQMIVMLIDKENRSAARRAAAEPGPVEPAPPVQTIPEATAAPDDTHIKARVGTIKTGLYLGLKHKAKARLGEDASVEAIMRDVYEQAVRAGIL